MSAAMAEKNIHETIVPGDRMASVSHDKDTPRGRVNEVLAERTEAELNITDNELHQAKEWADAMSLEETRETLLSVLKIHEHDPNFPYAAIKKIQAFLSNEDVFDNPEKHQDLINEVKIEAALITNSSPYAEVRAVVDNTDDPSMPSATLRVWVIGLLFVVAIAFVNELFDIRQPRIFIGANVAQLLCFPVAKLWEKTLPDVGFTAFGTRYSLNPGKFSKKEHMLITIMANVGCNVPYTNYIVWTQVLPQFFNQQYARQFSYQILIALSTNFIGYGLAGICRRFLVYPSSCVWPASLSTIALNASFHTEENIPVPGPFKRLYTMSRLKFFLIVFTGMFFYFFIPNYLFGAFQYFSWMTWIAPNNVALSAITGGNSGLGFNPLPTFDWNILSYVGDPLVIPWLSMINQFYGAMIAFPMIVAVWWTNTWYTGYLPINTNKVWDRFGERYNVSRTIDERGIFDPVKYHAYSPAYLGAANVLLYGFFFAVYSSAVSYTWLYHRHEIAIGFKNLWRSFKKGEQKDAGYTDVHNKLMSKYKEVPEWWYLIVLLIAVGLGCAGISAWETYTTVGVVFYGLALCITFVVPLGIIKAITGIEVTLNVLAEFIGGTWVAGNALAMNFFKSYGYVTCAHTLLFSNDLKLAHYTKIPPRHTFWAQMIATLVSTLVCTGVLQFQVDIKNVCDSDQPDGYTCPGVNTFFTAAVLWGTLAPPRVFGAHGYYKALLAGFPLGFFIPIILYYTRKYVKGADFLRNVHPVMIMVGGLIYAPYNLAYLAPALPFGWLSMIYMKKRFVAFWSKYNYVLSAALSTGIAVSGVIMFFALQYNSIYVNWWGTVGYLETCDGNACTRLTLAEGESFGPGAGEFY